jgi:hypothetical protein
MFSVSGFTWEFGRLGFSLGLDGLQWVSKIKNGRFLGCWIVWFFTRRWIINYLV